MTAPTEGHSRTVDPDAVPGDAPARRGAEPEPSGEEISFLDLMEVFLRHRWILVVTPLAAAFILVSHGFVTIPRTWTSTVVFRPQVGEDGRSRLRGLASQFGVSLSSGNVAQSPEFYVDLLQSREILAQAVRTEYSRQGAAHGGSPLPSEQGAAASGRATGSGTQASRASRSVSGQSSDPLPDSLARRGPSLVEAFEISAEDPTTATAAAVNRLKSSLSLDVDEESALVRVDVTLSDPELAAGVAGRLLELVNQFNLEVRQSQASAERRFLEERVQQAREDLQTAEDSLKQFLENNRRYENSPELVFEQQRLQRRVDLQQQIYTSLSQSLEEAKIDEVRNTPVITVVQGPEPPVQPDGRGLRSRGLLGLFLGGIAGVTWALGSEYVRAARDEEPDRYRELAQLFGEAQGDLESLWTRTKEGLAVAWQEGEKLLTRIRRTLS